MTVGDLALPVRTSVNGLGHPYPYLEFAVATGAEWSALASPPWR